MGEEVCPITDATPGPGKATGLAKTGVGVVVVGRDQDGGEGVVAEIKRWRSGPLHPPSSKL